MPITNASTLCAWETSTIVYGHHSPDYLKGAATAIADKDKTDVSVVESVVGKTRSHAKSQKINRIMVGPGGFEPPTRPL